MYDLCIIGFGISGISCSKIAKNKKLNYLVLEKNNNFGGCWNSRAFKWTRLQTHKKFYEFPDFKNVSLYSLVPSLFVCTINSLLKSGCVLP